MPFACRMRVVHRACHTARLPLLALSTQAAVSRNNPEVTEMRPRLLIACWGAEGQLHKALGAVVALTLLSKTCPLPSSV